MNIILMGKPGSGKGVQAKILSRRYRLHHISPGELFRDHIYKNTYLGKKIKPYIKSGKLVPDEIVDNVIDQTLKKLHYKDFIIDGYPRTIPEAVFLNSILKGKTYRVILLEVSDKTALERMQKRQKIEPRPENSTKKKMLERIEAYKKLTRPIMQKYQERGVLFKVDAEQSVKKVTTQINNLISN